MNIYTYMASGGNDPLQVSELEKTREGHFFFYGATARYRALASSVKHFSLQFLNLGQSVGLLG
jgi:hypothetical protein